MRGTVTKSTGSWYWVRNESGDLIECRIKGKFRIKGIKSTNPGAVGDHVEYDQFMKKFGMVEMSKGSFKDLLNSLDEKNIINFAKSIGSTEPKDFILFKWKKLTPDSVSEFIKMYFEHCGYGMCDMQTDDSTSEVSIHHDLGKKGSIFLKAFLEAIVRSSLERDSDVTITDNSVTLQFSN